MGIEGSRAIVHIYFEQLWNQGNLDVADSIVTPNYVLHDPNFLFGDLNGPEGLKQFVRVNRTAFPDIHFSIEDQIAEGNKMGTRWVATGTHDGIYMGIAPTGNRITVAGFALHHLEGSKIVEEWVNYAALDLLRQLGLYLPS